MFTGGCATDLNRGGRSAYPCPDTLSRILALSGPVGAPVALGTSRQAVLVLRPTVGPAQDERLHGIAWGTSAAACW